MAILPDMMWAALAGSIDYFLRAGILIAGNLLGDAGFDPRGDPNFEGSFETILDWCIEVCCELVGSRDEKSFKWAKPYFLIASKMGPITSSWLSHLIVSYLLSLRLCSYLFKQALGLTIVTLVTVL